MIDFIYHAKLTLVIFCIVKIPRFLYKYCFAL
jgi:hypothetical protein